MFQRLSLWAMLRMAYYEWRDRRRCLRELSRQLLHGLPAGENDEPISRMTMLDLQGFFKQGADEVRVVIDRQSGQASLQGHCPKTNEWWQEKTESSYRRINRFFSGMHDLAFQTRPVNWEEAEAGLASRCLPAVLAGQSVSLQFSYQFQGFDDLLAKMEVPAHKSDEAPIFNERDELRVKFIPTPHSD